MSTENVSTNTQTALNTAPTRRLGRINWFNNKAGYGFLKIVEDDGTESTDVFVHHSAIKVTKEQFRYLVQGEYVDFTMSEVDSENHKFQAADVTGVNGCKLMCETRNEVYNSRSGGGCDDYSQEPIKSKPSALRQKQPPSSSSLKEKEWTTVKKTNVKSKV